MSVIVTKKQIKQIIECLDDGDDDTEIRIRKGKNHGKSGVLVSFPEYDQDGEVFLKKCV